MTTDAAELSGRYGWKRIKLVRNEEAQASRLTLVPSCTPAHAKIVMLYDGTPADAAMPIALYEPFIALTYRSCFCVQRIP